MIFTTMLMNVRPIGLWNRHAGNCGFAHIEWRTISAEHFDRGPLGKHWNRWRRIRTELASGIDDLPAHNRESRFDALDRLVWNGEVIFGQDGKMTTYAAMVVACALALWGAGFVSRSR